MDVLVFLGSPRKKGNSEILTEALLEGVSEEGGMPEIIRLCDLKISPCISCGGCDKTGKCVVEANGSCARSRWFRPSLSRIIRYRLHDIKAGNTLLVLRIELIIRNKYWKINKKVQES